MRHLFSHFPCISTISFFTQCPFISIPNFTASRHIAIVARSFRGVVIEVFTLVWTITSQSIFYYQTIFHYHVTCTKCMLQIENMKHLIQWIVEFNTTNLQDYQLALSVNILLSTLPTYKDHEHNLNFCFLDQLMIIG